MVCCRCLHKIFTPADATPAADEESRAVPILPSARAMATHRHTYEPDGADDCAATGAHDDSAAPQRPRDPQGDGANTDAKDGHSRAVGDHD